MKDKKGDKPNCHKCIFRRAIPGDAHLACAAPPGTSVEGHPFGIEGGWFQWPHNYDPNWVVKCDGFEEKA